MWLTRRTALAAGLAASLSLNKSAGAVTYADYMLHLINIERRKAGVDPVTLGDNGAAQRHADMMVKFCHGGHWGIDGLAPYMRYSLAGGYQSNSENVATNNACRLEAVHKGLAVHRGNIGFAIHAFITGFMESPGHRSTMLDKWHKKVNIGLAWNDQGTACVNHFEGDYVYFTKVPAIEVGQLSMIGRSKNEIRITDNASFVVMVEYHPPTHLLTIGQLMRVGVYSSSELIGYVVAPNVQVDIGDVSEGRCLSPYNMPEDASLPMTSADVKAIVSSRVKKCERSDVAAPTLRADEWATGNDAFVVDADISTLLAKWGDGVYTIVLYHIPTQLEFSKYSIFYGVEPPVGY